MTCQIEITTRDGMQFGFGCEADRDLLSAAAEADYTLPSQCRNGSCGSCHATVAEGDYDLREHSANALPRGEPDAILLCRTVPRSDLRIVVPYDSSKVLREPVPVRTGRIVSLECVATDTMHLALLIDPDDTYGSAVQFEAGQFAELEIPGSDVRRPYSIANTSNWDGRLEFAIRLQPQGRFSTWLRESAEIGDALTVRGPQGGFGLIGGSLRPRWFVAGGTGLAPIIAILRRMAEYQEMDEARLFFGVTFESELFMLDELAQLQASMPQLQVTLCVWRAEENWGGFSGTPADALKLALAEASACPDIYVCGPPALVNAARDAAVAEHVPAGQFVSERFVS
ncbi:oxidoreductase [Caballeronia calidae]|uniref:Oxidoreductase n=1 Tax=Caballeronia calidae TaxID=1777139 RepID=A0A158D6I1_9BURK|nr:2Fe-2S iron-sulfur cluster binding domain-containing protein [Caballeronia calidae]SAK90199.1 oxidoreductase [Caballeronia calidae]